MAILVGCRPAATENLPLSLRGRCACLWSGASHCASLVSLLPCSATSTPSFESDKLQIIMASPRLITVYFLGRSDATYPDIYTTTTVDICSLFQGLSGLGGYRVVTPEYVWTQLNTSQHNVTHRHAYCFNKEYINKYCKLQKPKKHLYTDCNYVGK